MKLREIHMRLLPTAFVFCCLMQPNKSGLVNTRLPTEAEKPMVLSLYR